MPRIELDGKGDPIPTLALPPFGADSDLPATTLTFTDNADFSAFDYRNLGFTHFETWAVGGAGGRGGDATTQILHGVYQEKRPVPPDVWELYREYIRIQNYLGTGEWDHIYVGGVFGDGFGTILQAMEITNPNHLLPFYTYKEAALFPTIEGMGGAGGGGGLHKSAGALADLDDVVPIVVGKIGLDAGYGQVKQNGLFTPSLPLLAYNPSAYTWPTSRMYELANWFQTYENSYPLPHQSFGNPQAGGNGGASSFADTVCQASGGKGGAPGMIWNGSAFIIKGDGGDGGTGGQLTPGGGGQGSITEGVNGADGIWLPETGIGQGGGGGKGGRTPTTTGDRRFGTEVTTHHDASAGGQGSFSYEDTSVYGQRQYRQAWSYLLPTVVVLGSGVLSWIPKVDATNLVIPGGGGGARPLSNLKVGARTPGYSPNGVVVIRLVKITE